MESVIGKNREESLKQLREQRGEFYIPGPSGSMSCQDMQSNYERLNAQILFWNDEMAKLKFKIFSGDKKEAKNIEQIMMIQADVIARYETEMQRCIVDPGDGGSGTGPADQEPGPGESTPGSGVMDWIKKNPLIVGGAAIALVMIYKRSQISGRSDRTGIWIAGAAAVIAIVALNKNRKPLIEVVE